MTFGLWFNWHFFFVSKIVFSAPFDCPSRDVPPCVEGRVLVYTKLTHSTRALPFSYFVQPSSRGQYPSASTMLLLDSDAGPDHTSVIHDVRIIQTPFWLLTMLLFHKHDSQVPSSFAFLLEPWIACLLLESGLLHHDANQGQAPSLAPPLLDVSLTRLYRSRPSWPLSMQCISHFRYEVGLIGTLLQRALSPIP